MKVSKINWRGFARHFSGWLASAGIGYFIAFLQYQDQRAMNRIEVWEMLSNFNQEVADNYSDACTADGNLQGIYLSRFEAMTGVVGDQSGPCPMFSGPIRNLSVTFVKRWENIEEFRNDANRAFILQIGNGVISIPIPDESVEELVEAFELAAEPAAADIRRSWDTIEEFRSDVHRTFMLEIGDLALPVAIPDETVEKFVDGYCLAICPGR